MPQTPPNPPTLAELRELREYVGNRYPSDPEGVNFYYPEQLMEYRRHLATIDALIAAQTETEQEAVELGSADALFGGLKVIGTMESDPDNPGCVKLNIPKSWGAAQTETEGETNA